MSVLSAYAAIFTGVVLGRIPVLGLVSLLTVPIAYKTISILKTYYREPRKMAPANLGMICTHNFTAILLALAYFFEGFRPGSLVPSFLPLIVLIILYFPIGRLVMKAVFSREGAAARAATV